jgi:hypothetical protein
MRFVAIFDDTILEARRPRVVTPWVNLDESEQEDKEQET